MAAPLAFTCGDPAGVGPEIIVGAWSETIVHDWCRPVVVGHPESPQSLVFRTMAEALLEEDRRGGRVR